MQVFFILSISSMGSHTSISCILVVRRRSPISCIIVVLIPSRLNTFFAWFSAMMLMPVIVIVARMVVLAVTAWSTRMVIRIIFTWFMLRFSSNSVIMPWVVPVVTPWFSFIIMCLTVWRLLHVNYMALMIVLARMGVFSIFMLMAFMFHHVVVRFSSPRVGA